MQGPTLTISLDARQRDLNPRIPGVRDLARRRPHQREPGREKAYIEQVVWSSPIDHQVPFTEPVSLILMAMTIC
jgi:hypothetical protein